MAITKFEHENNGNAWVIDDPSSLDELEEKAREILSEKQIEFFKNYPASLNQFIEQAKFIENQKHWRRQRHRWDHLRCQHTEDHHGRPTETKMGQRIRRRGRQQQRDHNRTK